MQASEEEEGGHASREERPVIAPSDQVLGPVVITETQVEPDTGVLRRIKVRDFSAALDLWLIWPDMAVAPKPRFVPVRNALLTALADPLAMVS
jgi:hypothetical protein